ncbi:hypothetical protein [Nisaea sp.]|uniref:hypothetical protein n=1 Tax=Alphaproteobacteria TaxID=28211 RepID=UPI0032667CBC
MTCRALIIILFILLSSAARADLAVTFVEAAPKDLFIVENRMDCDLYDFGLQIDLRSSAGGLLFDISEGGAGASVYQPFEIAEGHGAIRSFEPVTDGDRVVSILFDRLDGRSRVVFTVDVDDTLPEGPYGQTMIDGLEIAGSKVFMTMVGEPPSMAAFLPSGEATVKHRGCGPVS